ncbi:hypothetical protein BD626DRAFT_628194 [Schizophyllum amplum]|uniref:Uncharacterized protein n=1 Tax=Schizophyllum amplum TaxID=97359 RepID=A0A550CN69_9AGAR|nr:hypothetical protein BD626DRAFT_628194 [Auriculariopsis ampla]
MPFGLFSKKSKPSRSEPEVARTSTRGSADGDGDGDGDGDFPGISPSSEYIHADKHLPSSPNGRSGLRPGPGTQSSVYPNAAASSSKLKLPFSRKKTSSTAASTSTTSLATTAGGLSPPSRPGAGRKSFSTASDVNQDRLGPPPSRSAIFATYADPHNAHSTRSLPNDPAPSRQDAQSRPPPPKKQGLFHWHKSSPNTLPKPSPQLKASASAQPEEGAFNLKAFRHVGPSPSPSQPSPSDSTSSLVPPARPRPRNGSGSSDTSQRISVAAFREAQARRSLAGSPIPSMRSPSPGPMLSSPNRQFGSPSPVATRSPVLPAPSTGRPGYINRSAIPSTNPALGRKSAAYSTTTESDDDSSSEESSEEGVGLRRGGTVTQRPRNKPESRSAPQMSKPVSRNPVGAPLKSATAPSRANFQSKSAPAAQARAKSDDSETDSSDDDAPLAALVPPRRPDSSTSTTSSSAGGRPRPLLDIKELTSRPPAISRKSETDEAFTQGRTLLSSKPASSPVRSPLRSPLTQVTSSEPPAPFISPPPSPVKASHALPKNAPLPPPPDEKPPSSFQRMSPMRRSTAESAPSPTNEKPRGTLADRLHRVVVQDAARSTSPTDTASSSSSQGRYGMPEPSEHKHIGHGGIKRESTGTITPANHFRRKSSSDGRARPAPTAAETSDLDTDLMSLLGGGIRLISKEGEADDTSPTLPRFAPPIAEPAPTPARRPFNMPVRSKRVVEQTDSDEESSSSSEEESDDETETHPNSRGLAPVPIARRTPPPAFRVTSRPHANEDEPPVHQRKRSSTLIPTPSPIVLDSPTKPNVPQPRKSSAQSNLSAAGGIRPRSTSLTPMMAMPPSSTLVSFPPRKPFANSTRTDSPASSTGDSSSGMAPVTPRDGSDVSAVTSSSNKPGSGWGSGVSGLGMGTVKGKHRKSRSVSFEGDIQDRGEELLGSKTDEQRRKERRRNEAKAAIELGNVINGRGPVLPDEENTQVPNFDPRMSMMNPMMMNMPMQFPTPTGGGWNMWPQTGQMLNPQQFMMPVPSDPAMYAAHQQAMMYAKHAYQMAAAQQAMAAAADEWERNSNTSAFGSGGSVAGGMSGMSSMRSSMMMQNWNPAGPLMLPGAPRSMYIGSAQSEFGGGNMGGGGYSSSQSVYGESFGPAKSGRNGGMGRSGGAGGRESQHFPPPPPIPQSSSKSSMQQQRPRTTSQPANPKPPAPAGIRRAPPPSSWKPSH